MQRHHAQAEQVLAELEDLRRERHAAIGKVRGQASELLRSIETGKDWKLRSKYDVQQLIRDCNLSVLQPTELVDDREPQLLAVAQATQHMQRIKRTFDGSLQFAPHSTAVDQGIRRLGLLERSLAEGNIDATPLARVADTMIVQVENTVKLPTLEQVVKGFEERIE